jgi:hypothetical protein
MLGPLVLPTLTLNNISNDTKEFHDATINYDGSYH